MEIKKVKKNKLNLMSLFSNEVEKAYEEGVYCDSPANRKLGRVGMTYKEWSQKQNEKKEDNKKDIDKEYEDLKWEDVSERSNNKRECLIGHDGTREGFRTIKEAKDGTIYYSPKTEGEWIKITKEQAVKLANSDPGFSKERNIEKENEILQRSDKKEEKKEDKKDEKKTKSLDDINWQDTDSPLEKEYKTSEGILKKRRVGRFGGYSYSINGENISEEKALEIVNKKDKSKKKEKINYHEKTLNFLKENEKELNKLNYSLRHPKDEDINLSRSSELSKWLDKNKDKYPVLKNMKPSPLPGYYNRFYIPEGDLIVQIDAGGLELFTPKGDHVWLGGDGMFENSDKIDKDFTNLAIQYIKEKKSSYKHSALDTKFGEKIFPKDENLIYRENNIPRIFSYFNDKDKKEMEKYGDFWKKFSKKLPEGIEKIDFDIKDGILKNVSILSRVFTMQGGRFAGYYLKKNDIKDIENKLEGKSIEDLKKDFDIK